MLDEHRITDLENKVDGAIEGVEELEKFAFGERRNAESVAGSARQQLVDIKKDLSELRGEMSGFKEGFNDVVRKGIYVVVGAIITYILAKLGIT